MELHLKAVGFLLIFLALIHIVFPRYFDWENDLGAISLINRQIMYVHTFFIALTVFLMGILCLTNAADLIRTTLGQKITLGLGVFWAIRLFVQLFGYSSNLWRKKRFETSVHILFLLLWTYVSIVFLYIYWRNHSF